MRGYKTNTNNFNKVSSQICLENLITNHFIQELYNIYSKRIKVIIQETRILCQKRCREELHLTIYSTIRAN